jgi:hypothetical protein
VSAPTIPLNSHDTCAAQRQTAVEGPNSVPADQEMRENHGYRVGGYGPSSDDGHIRGETHKASAVVARTSPEPAIRNAISMDRPPVRGTTPPAPAMTPPESTACAPVLADPLLALAADVLDDLERVRIANENRLRQLTRDETDIDGEERGFGLTLDHPDVRRLAALVEALTKAEHDAELQLNRLMRKHPLGPWVKQARGVGEKQGARLLAAIGDPYWNDLHDRPRTVSELWAYCGYHVLRAGQRSLDAQSSSAGSGPTGGNPDQAMTDAQADGVGVAAGRARGQKANWSADAKMRAHLVAVSIVKAGGQYREVYDEARAKYADSLHPADCRRCGPAGNPALAGTPRSAGHQHAMALRLVAKAVLRDLWREAKRLHEDGQGDGHTRGDTHRNTASP